MHEIVDKIFYGIWGIWRFRWTALLTAWLVASLGWCVVYNIEHKYLASARLYVDTNQVLEPLLQGLAVQNDVKQRVALLSQTLLSRPNLEQLIESTGLRSELTSIGDKGAVLDGLRRDIAIYDRGSGSLYTINYIHADPQIARQVVETLINIFVDRNQGEEREDNTSAQRFLDERIAEYERQLTAAEKRLSDFKRENAGSMPGESGGYFQRMEIAESKLRNASLALREAQNRRNELKRQLESKEPVLVSENPDWIPPDLARIQVLQIQLNDLLVRYTDRHPQVSQLRETIADLEARLANSPGGKGEQRSTAIPSFVHQQVSTMLAEAEAHVAELSVRASQYRSEYEELNTTIDSIPQVEAELAQLDRDYTTIRRQHTTLLERRESARLTEAVKKNSDNVKFQVIDPPFVESRPTIPNKKYLNVTVLIVALAAGGGLSLLLALLIPVFFQRNGLPVTQNVCVLGSVSLYRSVPARLVSWLGICLFLFLSAVLVAILPGLIFLEVQDIDLAQVLQSRRVPLLSAAIESDAYRWLVDSPLIKTLVNFLSKLL